MREKVQIGFGYARIRFGSLGNPVHFGVARAQAARILRCAYKRFDVVLGRQMFEKTRKNSNPLLRCKRVRESAQNFEPSAPWGPPEIGRRTLDAC